MDPNYSIAIMILTSIIIGYISMPILLGINSPYLRNNYNKLYGAIFMSLFMGFAEVAMSHKHLSRMNLILWISFLSFGILLFYYIIRSQVLINEKQYLKGMIEHHGMAIVMSEQLLKRTDVGEETRGVAQGIINAQEKEIQWMNDKISTF